MAKKIQNLVFYILILFFSFSMSAKQIVLGPNNNSQEEIQEALIDLEPGDVLTLEAGEYFFEDSLSLDIDDVVFEGSGIDDTILNFENQISGAQGLLITSNDVTIRDFAILDAKGDAIKVIGADGINMIRLRTEWTGGPNENNGAYGFYPVESKDVLIDGCVAIGASDAGIYVGQSQNIIVKNSIAQYNVAGIEIENSFYADVFDNLASHNTGGILIFDLPDLPQQGGHHVRVFRNKAINNDTDNFAPEGNIVGEVPRGTGIIIQANSNVEVFDNDIYGNGTVNLSIVTYGYETDDENYNPHPKAIQIHGNRFGDGGFDPDVGTGELAAILFDLSEGDMPDIFWDGILPMNQILFGQPEEERLIITDNGDATFLTIDPVKYMLPFFDPVERDISQYDGVIRPLAEVILN
tara:strand:- start:2391 stop:3617 length:1227 start_codon:yes stop_codon:yes gene_type:complete